ncbi:hypothetical protein Pcinc_021859 [Petrolisthes cinctipes]|uniref:C2H2-type domain-containing protein n=1 Tax=Petrolisthes cinctipes TaxID=88211 RepID=A0AAE1FF66_PETCI|nr:hypothetical protein Pcinc_021859 [Petrolisthes cinctipes]
MWLRSGASSTKNNRDVGLVLECQSEGLSTAQLSRLDKIARATNQVKMLLQNTVAEDRQVISVHVASITPGQATNTTAIPITALPNNPTFHTPFLPINHVKPTNSTLSNPIQPINHAIPTSAQPTNSNKCTSTPLTPSNHPIIPALPTSVQPTNPVYTIPDQPFNAALHPLVHPNNPAIPTNPVLPSLVHPSNLTLFTPVQSTEPSSLIPVHSTTTNRSSTVQSTTTTSLLPGAMDRANKSLSEIVASNNGSLNKNYSSKKLRYIYVSCEQHSSNPSSIKTEESVTTGSTEDKVNELEDKNSQTDDKMFPLLQIFLQPMNALLLPVAARFNKKLEEKLKTVFSYPGKRFVEWLLNEGLLRKTQHCKQHEKPIPMHFMFSETNQSDAGCGYLWYSWNCCKKHLSVYTDSIFELSLTNGVTSVSVLKLIYHWAYQTPFASVKGFVNVDTSFINLVYKYLRCVCSVVVEGKINNFGINGTTVEISIVNLGICWKHTSEKEAKVVVLGLYDRDTKFLRFFASEPLPTLIGEEGYLRILKPLKKVVNKNAFIVCDQPVEVQYLKQNGYKKVVWVDSTNKKNSMSNSIIVYYLCQRLPKMFQNTLSRLNVEELQMVLDELSWRERYGNSSASCYNTMVEHIIQLTTQEKENPVPGVIELLDSVMRVRHERWLNKMATGPSSDNTLVNNTNSSEKEPQHTPSTTNGLVTRVSPREKPVVPVDNNKGSCQPATTKETTAIVATLPDAVLNNSPGPSQSTANDPQRKCDVMMVDSYYYGTIQGNTVKQHSPYKICYTCHVCKSVFWNNILFYNHLKFHLRGNTEAWICCDFCLEHFKMTTWLFIHMKKVHLHSDEQFLWCRICSKRFTENTEFTAHMKKNHTEAELPYRCNICDFATSYYFMIINHFKSVHNGSPYLQCHYCLAIMERISTVENSTSFSEIFFAHLKTHLTDVWRCSKCELRFHHEHSLKIHITRDHISRASYPGLQRSCNTSASNKVIFVPFQWNKKKDDMSFMIESLSTGVLTILLADSSSPYTCIECKGNLQLSDHFPSVFKCTKCRYSTCCRNMVTRHTELYHPYKKKTKTNPQGYIRTAPPTKRLIPALCCSCGFNSSNGNRIARHLAGCDHGQKTAIPLTG